MKIVSTETLVKTKFLDFNATEYTDTKGKTGFWTWAQRPNGRKAVVIVAIVEGKLVVTKEFRVPIGDYEWSFPSGLVDEGEDIVTAATRELLEETGLKVYKVLLQSPYIYNTGGMTDESVAMVYVVCEGEISKEGLEDSEDIETFLMTQTEVYELLKDNTKKFGAKFWIVAQHFARNGSIL